MTPLGYSRNFWLSVDENAGASDLSRGLISGHWSKARTGERDFRARTMGDLETMAGDSIGKR
jgi:hypothetical protein